MARRPNAGPASDTRTPCHSLLGSRRALARPAQERDDIDARRSHAQPVHGQGMTRLMHEQADQDGAGDDGAAADPPQEAAHQRRRGQGQDQALILLGRPFGDSRGDGGFGRAKLRWLGVPGSGLAGGGVDVAHGVQMGVAPGPDDRTERRASDQLHIDVMARLDDVVARRNGGRRQGRSSAAPPDARVRSSPRAPSLRTAGSPDSRGCSGA